MQTSIREIRFRLFVLLLRAFALVLFLSFIFFIGVTGYFLTSSSTPIPFPFVNTLQGYYLANGSWDGVEKIFEMERGLDTANSILLDEEQRIILDHRPDSASTVNTPYEIRDEDVVIELRINNEIIGYLIFTTFNISARFGIARAILIPIGMLSFILALFLVVVATLLVRRFVNPLADVIYAARAVANGDLNTRIETQGPQDLRSLSESFNEMAGSLERNDRERRDMLADVAHELRTPLSVIRGRLEGIIDGVYEENGSQVSTALEQTYILERLIEDLRLLTLAETRQLQFDTKNVNVAELIERTIEMFSAESQEKNISLSFNERNGNLFAELDPQRFEQVMSNLIGNALRYVNENGKVWVTANATNEGLRITVNDNGAGIPEEDLPFIFDRFWRKDKSRSRTSGGTGLGLAISKQLVEAQGGTIEAKNLSEGGLQVMIEFKN
ncbi:MAG: HAMP domain-containing protein [Anaerolineales bacterium]|nr:HAMP domain-containing protein [Anaerolineales bacterium]